MGKWHRVVVERNSLTGPGLARPALRVLLLGIGGLALAGTLLSGGAWLYLTGVWIPNTPSRAAYPIRGLDVSHHQGRIDWPTVVATGVDFVYMKATEGGDWVDRQFVRNWAETNRLGLRRGAYHFFTLRTPGAKQAAHFVATVPHEVVALPPAVDLEFSGNSKARPTPAQFQRELEVFLDRLEQAYQTQPVVYTTYDFYDAYLQGLPLERLWVREVLMAPRGVFRNRWTFWQYSARGRVAGISGRVDLNVFAGNRHAFDALVHRPHAPEEKGSGYEIRYRPDQPGRVH